MASYRLLSALLGVFVTLTPALGAAPTPADRALATELFNQGRDELARGELASACPKLEESQRLDPGGGTLLNVAKCHEQQGKTASAWTEYSEALALAEREGQSERVAFAIERISALGPKLSRLVIVVPPGADRPDLVLLRDGTPVARAAWGTAMPIDPGHHVVTAAADGFRSWSIDIDVGAEADRDEVSVPALEPLPVPPSIAPPIQPQPPLQPAPLPTIPRPAPEQPRLPPGKIAGWTVASVGFAALAGATAAGIVTIVKDGASDERCDPTCDDEGYDLNQQAQAAADASTALFVVGAVAAAVGVTIVLVTPEAATPAVALLPLPGGGALHIRF